MLPGLLRLGGLVPHRPEQVTTVAAFRQSLGMKLPFAFLFHDLWWVYTGRGAGFSLHTATAADPSASPTHPTARCHAAHRPIRSPLPLVPPQPLGYLKLWPSNLSAPKVSKHQLFSLAHSGQQRHRAGQCRMEAATRSPSLQRISWWTLTATSAPDDGANGPVLLSRDLMSGYLQEVH